MKIISFITEHQIIRKILEHLELWAQKPSRDPPNRETSSENNELIYEPFYDDWPGYEEPCFVLN
ncbi:MAG: hypothetical protein ACYSWS_03760 [Planctomycetota bacterium]|jgi:hypothetical protein